MKLKIVAALLMAIAIVAPGFTRAFAQDSTPAAAATLSANSFAAPFAPAPELCTTPAMSTDEAASILATPTALVEWPKTANGIIALPGGTNADDATVSGVLTTLEQMWACNNAKNDAALLSLFSTEGLQMSLGVTSDSTWSYEEIRSEVAAKLTPEDARDEADWASIDAVVSVLNQPDGSVGVLVLNTDPLVERGAQVLDYFSFVNDGTSWKLSRLVLDPFDLKTGYGFDKAA